MSQIRLFLLAALVCLPVTASSAPQVESSLKKVKAQLSGSIKRGNSAIGINSNEKITIHTPKAPFHSRPIRSLQCPKVHPAPMPLAYSVVPSNQFSIIQPDYRPYIHRFQTRWNCSITSEFFFSTASGGFGSRINYDHKISPHTRFMASPEFLTYSLSRASTILGDLMPPGITRITLIAIPIGLQRHFAPTSRINPHIGFGVGPIIRLDHRSHRPGTTGIIWV